MPTVRQINQNITEGGALKTLAQAYSEVASVKLNSIRSQIERNTSFAKELADLMYTVKQEASKRGVLQSNKKPGVIHLLVTSNYRFYGDLERSLIRYFIKGTDSLTLKYLKIPQYRIVIGKSASSYLQGSDYRYPYFPVSFKKDVPDDTEVKKLIQMIKSYQTILVYHSRFQSVMSQIPIVSDISRTLLRNDHKPTAQTHIFEPEIDQIIDFFDTQITEILLRQTILESELSRTAARLISMDEAQGNADTYIKSQKKFLGLANRIVLNNRLLETAAALISWRKQNGEI